MAERILVFCAHNDDQVIGAGGTILKYSKEGKEIYTYIFSYGESSHPHFKPKVIIETRVKESKKSDRVLGIGNTSYLGLKEGAFLEEAKKKHFYKKITDLIKKLKPTKIFTHSMDDAHPDHRAVFKVVNKVTEDMDYNGEVYMFEVWNLFTFRKRNEPRLIVDITPFFRAKVRAFREHKSQQVALWTLMWHLYFKAILNGFNNNVRYAEVFYRAR